MDTSLPVRLPSSTARGWVNGRRGAPRHIRKVAQPSTDRGTSEVPSGSPPPRRSLCLAGKNLGVALTRSLPSSDAMHAETRRLQDAQRARRYRSRRRRGSRVVPVSLTQPEMDALVRLKLLEPELRHDRQAVTSALRSYISDRLWREKPT